MVGSYACSTVYMMCPEVRSPVEQMKHVYRSRMVFAYFDYTLANAVQHLFP